jgi:hypothetical protein
MEFSKAQQEFQIRYYLWAISEWEKEIGDSFPNLRSFKSGHVWETYQFMRLLDKGDQLLLARGLLKRFHPQAAKSLGETSPVKEESLRRARDDFFKTKQQYQIFQELQNEGQTDVARFMMHQLRGAAAKVPGVVFFDDDSSLLLQLDRVFKRIPSSLEEEIAARKRAGEKIRFPGKRKLQKAITEKFNQAFGSQCISHDYDDVGDPYSSFGMKCCGWNLSTNFWFGRSENLINYIHSITSPTIVRHERHPEITAPTLQMAIMISFGSWLGITSQIEWKHIFSEDVEATCDAVIEHCRRFLAIAPKLLKGLEFETIVAN